MMVEQDEMLHWVSGAPQKATKENVSEMGLPTENPGARRQARWDQAPQASDGAKLLKARRTSYSLASTERVCAREAERNLRTLDLSREQAETVERISHSLVDELVHGRIEMVTTIIEITGESAVCRKA
jgi:hypothetical protein